MNFCLWPEDPTPESQQNCQDCGLFQQGSRMIWGEGNPKAPILILLDNPGEREDREERPYVCTTRQTLQRAVHESGLSADDFYVTYVLKRKPKRAYDKERTREICLQHLQQQLVITNLKLVFCLGNVAVQSFFQDEAADVKTLRGKFYDVRGFQTTVAYHPFAVSKSMVKISGGLSIGCRERSKFFKRSLKLTSRFKNI